MSNVVYCLKLPLHSLKFDIDLGNKNKYCESRSKYDWYFYIKFTENVSGRGYLLLYIENNTKVKEHHKLIPNFYLNSLFPLTSSSIYVSNFSML